MAVPYSNLNWYIQDEPIEGTDDPTMPRGVGNRPLAQLLENDLQLEDDIQAIWRARGAPNGFAPLDDQSILPFIYLFKKTLGDTDAVLTRDTTYRWRGLAVDPAGVLQTGLSTGWWKKDDILQVDGIMAPDTGPMYRLWAKRQATQNMQISTSKVEFDYKSYPLYVEFDIKDADRTEDLKRLAVGVEVYDARNRLYAISQPINSVSRTITLRVPQDGEAPGPRYFALTISAIANLTVDTRLLFSVNVTAGGQNLLSYFDNLAAIHALARGQGLIEAHYGYFRFWARFSNGIQIAAYRSSLRYRRSAYSWSSRVITLPVRFINNQYLTLITPFADRPNTYYYSRVGHGVFVGRQRNDRYTIFVRHYPNDRRDTNMIFWAFHLGRWK